MPFDMNISASLGPSNGKNKNPVTDEETKLGVHVVSAVFSAANVCEVKEELLEDIPEDVMTALEEVIAEDRVGNVQGYCKSTLKKVVKARNMHFRHDVTLSSICQKATVKAGLLTKEEAKEHFPSYYKSKKKNG